MKASGATKSDRFSQNLGGDMSTVMKIITLVSIIGFFGCHSHLAFAQDGNTKIKSFRKAKKHLQALVFTRTKSGKTGHKTIYCGCSFDDKKNVDWSSCGYKPKSMEKRAKRIEWEHVVPAHAFGKSFEAWWKGHPDCMRRNGKTFKGRKCAEKVNKKFQLMQADMYNLFPAVGEINARRSNYSMGIIPGEKREFGSCDAEIKNRKFEPRPVVRGDIARTYMYMDKAYPGHGIISRKNNKLFKAWDKADPVNSAECQRIRSISKIQGNTNEVVERACKSVGL